MSLTVVGWSWLSLAVVGSYLIDSPCVLLSVNGVILVVLIVLASANAHMILFVGGGCGLCPCD